jgi:hypothetical protein
MINVAFADSLLMVVVQSASFLERTVPLVGLKSNILNKLL